MSETAGCIARCITVIIRRGVRSILRSSGRGKGGGGGGGGSVCPRRLYKCGSSAPVVQQIAISNHPVAVVCKN